VTLVPEMAKTADHVTMLQRSPTYIVSRPAEDAFALRLRKLFPSKVAYGLTRWKNTLMQMLFFKMARRRPEKVKQKLVDLAREELGEDYDVETHLTPSYNPWDQRLCLIPDSDLFTALRDKSASIVTDTIETFTPSGIQLTSGETVDADIVVSATGLQLEFLGGARLLVDGQPVNARDLHGYRGIMFSNVPNLVATFGYTNASWTLKADLIAKFVSRLLKHMDSKQAVEVRPLVDEDPGDEPWLDFSSGYVTRARHKLPRQGRSAPWRLNQNYLKDIFEVRFASLDDEILHYRNAGDPAFSSPVQETSRPIAAE
jgi:cation diffusion facilitator CzcD-associated flavoprotein CzcO